MINLAVDNKDFEIVNSYDELTLGQYIDIMRVGDKSFPSSMEADIEIISMLCTTKEKGLELKQLLFDFDFEDFNMLRESFEWVAKEVNLLEDYKKLDPKESININGKDYGIISNFNKGMKLGEIVSYETIMAREQSDLHRFDIAFGIILRPIIDGKLANFTEDIFTEVLDNKYNVKMIDIYSALSFFLSGEKISTIKNTKRFSIQAK